MSQAPAAALSAGDINAKVGNIALASRSPLGWQIALFVASMVLLFFLISVGVLFYVGVGIWGINIPVAWGTAIVNFVWWIGIGHAGTFISAILFLSHQEWRRAINRFAEAMTLFAVMCAGMFPLLHLGRPARVYWLIPYPNTMELWPQFRSALIWDEFAVFTYFTVSLMFWYLGLIPDLALLRDSVGCSMLKRRFYGIFALGWQGSARQWYRYEIAYAILAGLATPLVVSVHSIVSTDFAMSVVPGWHDPIFPPYFVAGALFSGFAMVITITIPVTYYFGLQQIITDRHFDLMAKIMLATGMFVAYGYACEGLVGWLSDDPFEWRILVNRFYGPGWWVTWLILVCNVFLPLTLWWPSLRVNRWWLFIVSIVINIGMWFERYMIVALTLQREFLPSSYGVFHPTFWDYAFIAGSIGLFLWLLVLFVRYIPMVSMHELRRSTINE